MRERNTRAFSLQNLRAASLEFQPIRSPPINQRQLLLHSTLKSPFFLKMHGYCAPKLTEDILTKKSNFVYNYCLEENNEPGKPLKLNEKPRKTNGKYLKLETNSDNQKLNNLKLLEELK